MQEDSLFWAQLGYRVRLDNLARTCYKKKTGYIAWCRDLMDENLVLDCKGHLTGLPGKFGG